MTKLFLAIGMSLALSGAALAQQNSTREQIVGAWSLVSIISETEDGERGEPFGTAPKGVMIFSSAGHFSLFQSRAEIPKIAANDRAKATPEEAQAIVASTMRPSSAETVPWPPPRPPRGQSASSADRRSTTKTSADCRGRRGSRRCDQHPIRRCRRSSPGGACRSRSRGRSGGA